VSDASGDRTPARHLPLLDLIVVGLVAASYPLYIAFDALPRVAEVGPPVSDRYPWLVVAIVVVWLGVRCRTPVWCLVCFAVLMLGVLIAYADDDAVVTGVLISWRHVAPVAASSLAIGQTVRLAAIALKRRTS